MELGFRQFRVRYTESESGGRSVKTARIEVEPAEIFRFAESGTRENIVRAFLKIGFTYVTLDLQGYRTGSLNEPIGSVTRRAG
ncbi:MAG: hypothetical protein HY760_02520 [Nitrospirae bacterium]|nr:hypothetical protein [Nitrospirota bacterium]